MNRTQTAIAMALVLGSLSATARADTLSEELSEANKEGRIWTSFALNPHLDALDLGIDVEGETATLTGTVPGAIERDLAAEVALGISGVKRVDVDELYDVRNYRPKVRHVLGKPMFLY